jgi:nucleoside-diphosphate-sugar epimerase
MEIVALLGATGSLGRALGRQLHDGGLAYRAVSRSHMGLKVRFGDDPLAQPVLWDPGENPASVLPALEGAGMAVYLAGVPVWEFDKHISLTRLVIDAAKKAGLRRLLLVSSNWAYGAPRTEPVSEDHPLDAQTAKGRIRREQEQLVLAAHGEMETAVLRIGDFYGPYVEASYLWSAFRSARNGTIAQLMSPADTRHEFVFVPDAARAVLRMLDVPDIWGRAWNLGGRVSTIRAMTEAIFAEAGQPARYELPPPWKMRIVALMNPYVREMREMQYLLDTPVILDDSALGKSLGGLVKTPFTQGIGETLPTVRIGR